MPFVLWASAARPPSPKKSEIRFSCLFSLKHRGFVSQRLTELGSFRRGGTQITVASFRRAIEAPRKWRRLAWHGLGKPVATGIWPLSGLFCRPLPEYRGFVSRRRSAWRLGSFRRGAGGSFASFHACGSKSSRGGIAHLVNGCSNCRGSRGEGCPTRHHRLGAGTVPSVFEGGGGGETSDGNRATRTSADYVRWAPDDSVRAVSIQRRWTLPDGAPRSVLSLPSVFENCRDVAAELFHHPLTSLVDRVDDRVTIRSRRNHHFFRRPSGLQERD